jgi:hypothetical protein
MCETTHSTVESSSEAGALTTPSEALLHIMQLCQHKVHCASLWRWLALFMCSKALFVLS